MIENELNETRNEIMRRNKTNEIKKRMLHSV
jgi:hypothetical protein